MGKPDRLFRPVSVSGFELSLFGLTEWQLFVLSPGGWEANG